MIHRSSITTKSDHWFTDLLQQQSQQRHNHNHNNSDLLALHVRSILRHCLRFQTNCWIEEVDRRSQLTRGPNSPIGLSPWRARSPPSYRRLRLWSLRFWRRRRSWSALWWNERELRWESEREEINKIIINELQYPCKYTWVL